jgi:hypothetical protein
MMQLCDPWRCSLAYSWIAHPLIDTRSLSAKHEHLQRSVHTNVLSNGPEKRTPDEWKEMPRNRNRNPSLERRTSGDKSIRPLPNVPVRAQTLPQPPTTGQSTPASVRPLPAVPLPVAGSSSGPGTLVQMKANNRKATLTSAPDGAAPLKDLEWSRKI